MSRLNLWQDGWWGTSTPLRGLTSGPLLRGEDQLTASSVLSADGEWKL